MGALEGLPQPDSVLPALSGVSSPAFSQVGDSATQKGLFMATHRSTSEDARLPQAGPTGARTFYEGLYGSLRFRLGGSRT